MKITEGKYFEFYERLEKLLDYHIKFSNHSILVDVFNDEIVRFLDTDYLKFSLTKNGYQTLSLNICGFDENDSIIFCKQILESECMRVLEAGESFDVFSNKIEISNIPMGKVDLFNDLDNNGVIIKTYKDFLKISVFSFDEEYSQKQSSSSFYLNSLDSLLNMMLLAPKQLHAQDYVNNKSKSLIQLIFSEYELQKLFPEKAYTVTSNGKSRNFDFIYDIMSIKQKNDENPFEDDFLLDWLLKTLNVGFVKFSFAFSKIKTLFEIWNSESYEPISVEKSKYPDFYDFIYKLKTKKDPDLKLFTYSGDIDFKVSDLDKIFTLKQ